VNQPVEQPFYFAVPLDFLLTHGELARRQRVNAEVFADGDVLHDLDPARVSAARALLDSARLGRRVHGPISEMALGAFDPRIREVSVGRYRQSIAFAEALGARALVAHTGFDILNKRDLADRYFALFVPSLRLVARMAAEKGIRILVENTFEPSPKHILDAVDAAGEENVGLLFDIAHHHLYGRTPLDEWLACWGRRIEEVHLTDTRGDWDFHLAPGAGEIDFDRFFALRRELGIRPVFTFEPHDLDAFAETLRFIQEHPGHFT
jgi:sugar phosphate isomerase/epimerase